MHGLAALPADVMPVHCHGHVLLQALRTSTLTANDGDQTLTRLVFIDARGEHDVIGDYYFPS